MQVSLLDHQKQHYAWARDLLAAYYGYIDTSVTGAGKTHVALALAQHYNLSLFVVCPLILKDMWNVEAEHYGVHITTIISYDTLRGVRNHELSHPYLTRTDDQVPYGQSYRIETNFRPTAAYTDQVNNGILLVIDEFQKIKNDSAQALAAISLINPIMKGGKSRFALLSATPLDKVDHTIQLLRALNLIQGRKLCTYDRSAKVWNYDGFNQLVEKCHQWNSEVTSTLMADKQADSSAVKKLAHELFCGVILPIISSAMPKPDYGEHTLTIQNGFFKINDACQDALRLGVAALQSVSARMDNGNTTPMFSDITKALVQLEKAKVLDMARVARNELSNGRKVIISVSYLDTISALKKLLPSALILQGSVKPKDRSIIIEAFNTTNCNLLIMNTEVGGMGISLHDKVGNAPRTMLISPNYHMLAVIQAGGRVHRVGVRSSSQVYMFYGQGEGLSETNILSALIAKSSVLSTVLTTERVPIPGDYSNFIE